MTKTPEELTEDWEAGKLPAGWYYLKLENGEIELQNNCIGGFLMSCNNRVIQILAPVPTYDEYKAMQEQLNKEGTWYTEISYKKIKKENNQLRDLLRECKRHLYFQKKINNEVITLLTRINAALGESEE